MFAYLTNARCWLKQKSNEELCDLTGLEYLHNQWSRMGEWMHLGMDLEVGSLLYNKYSATQSPPGYYCSVKWWDSGPVQRAWTEAKDEIEIPE